jgi:hypothetical protein
LFQISTKCRISSGGASKKSTINAQIVPVVDSKFVERLETGTLDEIINVLGEGSKKDPNIGNKKFKNNFL